MFAPNPEPYNILDRAKKKEPAMRLIADSVFARREKGKNPPRT